MRKGFCEIVANIMKNTLLNLRLDLRTRKASKFSFATLVKMKT